MNHSHYTYDFEVPVTGIVVARSPQWTLQLQFQLHWPYFLAFFALL